MIRSMCVRAIVAMAAVLCCASAFGANYVSNGSGFWDDSSKWTPNGVPGTGDTVTISNTDTITVRFNETVDSVAFNTSSGTHTLVIDGATLTVEAVTNAFVIDPVSSIGTNEAIIQNGGILALSNGSLAINGGPSSLARLSFGSGGGTLDVAGDILFSGTQVNAQIDFANNAGTVYLAGDLGNGGNIFASGGTFIFNGSGAQTINSYTFNHFKINKPGGTATLNGAITVDGDFRVESGVLDDGGNQIDLNAGVSSNVFIGSTGVLKLGNASTATNFPSPLNPANVSMDPGAAVDYQAGVAQTLATGFDYQRLYVTTTAVGVTRTFTGSLHALQELNVGTNVALNVDAESLDVDGNIAGTGSINVTTGSINVEGSFDATIALSTGTGTVTYDGSGAQNILATSYHHLVIEKSGGIAALTGNTLVAGNFRNGTVIVGIARPRRVTSHAGALTSGTFDASTYTATFEGNFENHDSVAAGSAAFVFSGSALQFVTSDPSLTIGSLTINNASGVSMVDATSINTALNLAQGTLTVADFFVDVNATITRTNGWIIGPLTLGMNASPSRVFPIGTSSSYLPVTADASAGGTLTIQAVEGQHPNATGTNTLLRYWTISAPATVASLDVLTFGYNVSDVSGTEASYVLSQYAIGTWTTLGDVVNEGTHLATATNVTSFLGDWVAGSAGSTGFASTLAITSVNSGADPAVNTAFDVAIEARDDNGSPANVSAATGISLAVLAGAGTLGGTTTGTIAAGTNNTTISGVTYDTVENGVVLRASSTSGDTLNYGDSAIFNVTGSSTATVTNLNDSGAGSLRDAISNANSGACPAPCTIDFSVSGAIVLSSALPPIVADNLTIDGFTAPGSSANTNAFGIASNAVITVALDGNGAVATGLEIQGTFDKIKGLAIGNFTSYGVKMVGDNSGSKVSGCHIGTDTSGTTANANGLAGVYLLNSTESSVGGFAPADRNVISGNTLANGGIYVDGTSNTVSLIGNYVGVRADLTGALPNVYGIVVASGSSVAVGSSGTGNVISGNTAWGLVLLGNNATVESNYIGTAGNSSTAIGNNSAIQIGGNNNTIGGTTSPAQQNTISGNVAGLLITGDNNVVDQNLIGIAPDGTTALANSGTAILFTGTASSNKIGDVYGNAIAYNQRGVNFDSGVTGTGNSIRRNRIFAHAYPGIDINEDGVTNNDAGDSDTGPNNIQNFPVIAGAQKSGGNLSVTFSLDSSSVPSTGGMVVDFFKADASANPQAQTWLGDSGCLAGNNFSNSVVTVSAGTTTVGDKIIATATSYSDGSCTTIGDGTSEFSAAATVTSAAIHWIGGTGAWETASNWDSGTVPGAGDTVLIDQAGTYTVTINSNAAVSAIQIGTGISGTQTLTIAAAASLTLATASSVTTTGVLSFAGNALTASGGLDVDGKLDWDGTGSITGAGTYNIDGSLNINNAGTRVLESLVNVSASGGVNWYGGNLTLQNGGAFDNYGTFEALSDGTISDGGSDAGFDNFNLFRKSVTTGATTFTGVDFNSSGTIALQTGSLGVTGGTSTGAITLAGGTEILFNSIVYTLGTGTNVSGLGKLHISGGTVTVSGAASIDNIAIDAGTLNGSGAIALGGQFFWTGGVVGGSGTISVASTAAVNVTGASSKVLDGRTLSLGVSGAAMSLAGTGGFNLQNGGNIAIAAGATLDLQGDATIFDNGADGGINNAGTLQKSAGTTSTILNVDIINSGTLKVITGTLNAGNITNSGIVDLSSGDLQIDLGDTVNFNTGTTVTGTGIVHVAGGTLNVNDAVGIPNLDLTSGTIAGTGALSCTSCTWSGGTMSGSGTTTIPNAATLTVSGTSSKVLARTLSISTGGISTWGGSNTIFMQSGGAIANAGTMSITQPLFFTDNGAAGDITNSGSLTINTSGTAWLFVTLNSTGTLTLTNGSLNLFDGTSSGAISIGASSTLIVDDSSYNFASGTSLSGSGLLSVTTGGTLSIGTAISSSNFDLSGGTITGSGTLTLTGTAGWSNGTMTGGGSTIVQSPGTLTLSGASGKLLANRALDTFSGGTISLTGTGTLTLQSGASITNAGTFDITSDSVIANGGAAGPVTNNGTWRKSTATGTTTLLNLTFNNTSLVDLQSGILALSGGAFSQSSGTLQFTLSGTTAGTGFGQLTTTNAPALAGTLSILLGGVYQPVGSDTFRVLGITGGSHSGDFTTTNYPPLTGGRTMTRAYDASGLLLTVNGVADVSISKVAPGTVATGGAISYTLTVNNAGPDLATGVIVTDTLTAGHTGISASGTGWSCNVASLTVTCSATASLVTGNANAITINATAPTTPQTFINTASVSATNDTNNANDSGTATVTVSATDADVSVSGSGPLSPVAQSTPTSVTFTVANAGPATATSVQLSAPIPSTLTYSSAGASQGSCNFVSNTVTCNLGTIASLGSATVTINLVTTTTAGSHAVTATVSAAEADGTPGNNTTTVSVAVSGNVVTVTNASDSGDGSLRQALLDASSGTCTAPCSIQFALASAPATIVPGSALPDLASNATLDATTQSGYSGTPLIILNGFGLSLSGTGATVKGLAIFNASPAVKITGNGNTVRDSYLGLDAGQNIGSGATGVIIEGSSNTIDSNVISGNSTNGLVVQASASGNTIQGNRIGTDASGTSARPNGIGVLIDGGATIAAHGPQSNVLLIVTGTTLSGNTISNNTGDGVFIGSADNTLVDSNTIASNGGNGVVVTTGTSNEILTNSIFSNAGLGIDLGNDGATANDAGDADSGANGLQNFPTATGAYLIGAGDLTVTYNIDSSSAPVGSVQVEIFKDDNAGEGKSWLAAACIAGNNFASGTSFNAPSIVAGDQLVLSATSYSDSACGTASDGTSEFSNAVTVTSCTPPPVTITGPTSSCASTPVTLDAGGGFAEYLWSNGATTQTITVSPASTSTYTVTVKDGIGCSNSDTHTVTVTSNPTVTITTAASVCENSSNNNANVSAVAGATYNWTVTNGTLDSGQGTSAITYTAGPSGSVGISVSVTSGSCTGSGSTSVPISAPPVVAIAGPSSVCPHTPFVLDAGSGYSSYLWSNGATTQTISVQQSASTATYSVTVTSNGCSATGTHVVTLTANPQAAISAPNSAAPSTTYTATVQAQAGATYNWSVANGSLLSGDGTDTITFKTGATGQTKLSVSIDVGGCTATDVHYVNISGGPDADLAVTKTAVSSITTGASFTYTIGIANNGPANATGITITDSLPAGTSLVSFNDGPWTCTASNGTLTCTGSAAAGSSSAISVVVTAPQQAGTITNTVTISSATNDPDASNNSASATTSVVAGSTNCATEPATLIAPSGGAFVDSPIGFSWTAVPGATLYEVWLANDTQQLLGSTTGTSLTAQLPNGANAWYVVAHLAGGCLPLLSQTATFNVNEANGCATHAAPQLSAPSQGATLTSPVTFSWMPVPQAIGYRVWIESNGTAAQDIGTTDGAITLTANVPAGATVAYVDALFSGCPATTSPSISFNAQTPSPCDARTTATLVAPANNAILNTSAVDFSWLAAANASGYRVWASVDGGTPAVLGTTVDDTTLHANVANGSVVWWVEALYDGCASVDSAPRNFTIPAAQQCGTAVPALVAPANGATLTGANVQFSWTSVPNAIAYELWVALDNGTPALAGTTSSTSITRAVAPGRIEWFVRAIVDRCAPRDSQSSKFTYQPPASCAANQRPVALEPVGGASIDAPAGFKWTAPAGATHYDVYVIRGNEQPALVASTNVAHTGGVNLDAGKVRWFVRAFFGDDCPPLDSTEQPLEIIESPAACATLTPPVISVPGQISSGTPFTIYWTPSAGATTYQLQLATRADFDDAQTFTTSGTSMVEMRTNNGTAPLPLFARVRAMDGRCHPTPTVTPYGPTSALFILPPSGADGSASVDGDGIVHFTIALGPELAGQTFSATPKQSWLTVSPASGVVAPNGTTLAVTANAGTLPLGTSLGAIDIKFNSSAGRIATNATSITPSFSVSLVTPVTPLPKNTPPPDALIIPAVAHADGINSKFQSDVRVSNTSPQVIKYQLTFTPSGTTGIGSGSQTTFSIEPGRTIALDDILESWFGTGTTSTTGTLEIRPLTQTTTTTPNSAFSGLANLVTFASSRTFNATSNGTFGQYIPAVPFANFIGSDAVRKKIISLQQIAQSDRYRTNLGLVEGSGQPASLLIKVFGEAGQKLTELPVQLNGGQHTQLNGFLANNGITSLSDGRVEIEVTSSTGKVTAYASVLDNVTSDPLLVTPVQLTDEGDSKWVLPGAADLNNGFANWQTDMRVFNAGTADVDATLTFYSQNGGTPRVAQVTIPAGQVKQFDKTVSTLFGATNDGGAVHIATAAPARLVATARTYNQTTGGTYGQFISAVTPAESAGLGSRPLQILQVEESSRFRSNIGLAEVTGNPVRVEIAVVPPDAKFTAVTQVALAANEFRQIGSLLKSVGLGDTFNARVTVRVLEGTGRVTAYASVIDAMTNDPTYVPAQ